MRLVFSPQAQGKCDNCGEKFQGGFLAIDDDNHVAKTLCYECQDFEKDLVVKKSKIVLRQVSNIIFWRKYYEVVSSKNIIFKSQVLDHDEVHRLVLCKNIDVDIKY